MLNIKNLKVGDVLAIASYRGEEKNYVVRVRGWRDLYEDPLINASRDPEKSRFLVYADILDRPPATKEELADKGEERVLAPIKAFYHAFVEEGNLDDISARIRFLRKAVIACLQANGGKASQEV